MATPASERTPLLQNGGVVQETEFVPPARADGNSSTSTSSSTRQLAPDLLRGLLMALMAMDHTSVSFGGYSHGTGVVSEATSTVIKQWNSTLPFVLRSATHLCAGGFAMLMGMGIVYFVESRKRQEWSAQRQFWHFTLRTVAMLLVNFVGWQLVVSLEAGWLWIFNIVLIALALDYFVVGGLYALIAYRIEPSLVRLAHDLVGRTSSCSDIHDEVEHNPASTDSSTATTIARTTIDVFLLVLAAVSLWAGVWTSPNQGACLVDDQLDKAAATAAHDPQELFFLGHAVSPTPRDYCRSAGSVLFGFFFQQSELQAFIITDFHYVLTLALTVTCLDRGILSSFPPVGWVPFVFFGLVYGRTLLRLSSPAQVSAFNAGLSISFALLFTSTRLFQYGNLSTNCLDTADQAHFLHKNQYLSSFKSFFYVVKYPPSPAFAFLTLSMNFLILYIFNLLSSTQRKVDALLRSQNNPLLVFGNNPLFFYGAHGWYVNFTSRLYLHSGLPGSKPSIPPSGPGRGAKPQIGLGWIFVSVYASVLIVMYFVCRAYGSWKRTKGRESVWRFL